MTYSIIGRDMARGEVGAAVQSKFPGVGSIVLHGRAGAGCITTQAFANPRHGEHGLDMLAAGVRADVILRKLLDDDPDSGQRQVALLGETDLPAAYTGKEVLSWEGWAGSATGQKCIASGNALRSPEVLERMINRFETTTGGLAERLINALRAGRDAGGELRGQQSAAILVVKPGGGYGGWSGRHVDISIYDHPEPIDELARCLRLHRLSYFPSDPKKLVPINTERARKLRSIMRAAGCSELPGSTPWGESEIALLNRFLGSENYDNRLHTDGRIDLEVLDDLRTRFNVPE